MPSTFEHDVAVVVPVYLGATVIEQLVNEILALKTVTLTPAGNRFRVTEIILVHDRGPDDSDAVLRRLARTGQVRVIWLARNSGQHAATVAGIAASGANWVVTMDEDGQHDPADIGLLLDCAVEQRAYLVYGRARLGAPHAAWRNLASRFAKFIARAVAGSDLSSFTSLRLVEGSRARAVSAYVGQRTYLDSALLWAFDGSAVCTVSSRNERRARSG